MKALLLAGGLGTRLRPLTHTRPKHLLPIVNRPHIDHVIDLLLENDVNAMVLMTSYMAESFSVVVQEARSRGMSVEVTVEKEPLGTAGAIKNAAPLVGDDTFYVLNADVLTDVSLRRALEFHRAREADATIVLTPVEDPSAFGVVSTDDRGLVTGFVEKPAPGEAPTNLINAGIYVCEPRILDHIPGNRVWSAERQLWPELVEIGSLYAVELRGYWTDIGTPQKYVEANLDALAGRYRGGATGHAPEWSLVDAAAAVAPGARLSSACVGPGVTIAADATVERSVLLAGVNVGAGAKVRDSVVGEGAVVAPGAVVTSAAIADREVVEV